MSKFEKLAADIRQQILIGALKPGDRLPSISKLREIHGVSYGTIRSAMLILKAEKLIGGLQGEGVYVREEIGDPAVEATCDRGALQGGTH